jgi:UDP-glucuronate decarboxylase
MKIFLTGATGFVGRQVRHFLLEQGHEVVGTSPRLTINHAITSNRVDLFDSVAVDNFLAAESPEGLIHLAWDTTPGTYWESSANLTWTAASLRLLESFSRHGGKRAVIAGTSAEYSWAGEDDLTEALTDLTSDSLYGISKDSLRRILEAWAPGAGISLTWGRIFCPFGPNEKSSRLIPKLILKLNGGEELEFDSGSIIRDFLHVEDLGAAFAALFDSDVEGAVNLASGEGLSIREVLSALGESLGRLDQIKFDAIPDPEGQPPRIVASIQRLQNEVNWSPTLPLRQRLAETCEWWVNNNNNNNETSFLK